MKAENKAKQYIEGINIIVLEKPRAARDKTRIYSDAPGA